VGDRGAGCTWGPAGGLWVGEGFGRCGGEALCWFLRFVTGEVVGIGEASRPWVGLECERGVARVVAGGSWSCGVGPPRWVVWLMIVRGRWGSRVGDGWLFGDVAGVAGGGRFEWCLSGLSAALPCDAGLGGVREAASSVWRSGDRGLGQMSGRFLQRP